MAQELMQSAATSPQATAFDVVTPFASRSLFWRPRFLRDTASLHHVPFLFWLVDTLRPKSFVTLGGGDGTMHFALCQAAEKLDLDARGYGYGPWPDGAVPTELARYNADTYPDLSRLSPGDPARAAGGFPTGSIDLLSVHLGQGGEAGGQATLVRDWIDSDWSNRLSARGVIVLHGANAALEQGHADGFLSRLADLHPTFHLDCGDGLILVLRGDQPDERLARLCTLAIGDAGYASIVQVFGRLGSAVHAEMSVRQQDARLDDLTRRAEQASSDLAQNRQAQDNLRAELTRQRSDLETQQRQMTETQARLADLHTRHSALIAAKTEQDEKLADLKTKLKATTDREAGLTAQLAKSTAALSDLEVVRGELENALTKQNWLRKDRERLQAEEAELRKTLEAASAAAQERIVVLEAEVATLQAEAAAAKTAADSATAALTVAQDDLGRQVQTLAAERETLAAEVTTLRAENVALAEQLAAQTEALQAQLAADAQHKAAAEARDAQQRQDIDSLRAALAASQGAAESLAHDLQARLDSLQAEAERRLEALTLERDTLAAEAEASMAQIAALTADLIQTSDSLQAGQAEWTVQRDDLQRQLRVVAAERDAMDGEVATLRAEMTALTDRLAAQAAEMQRQTETRAQESAAAAASAAQHQQEIDRLRAALAASESAAETTQTALLARIETLDTDLRILTDKLDAAHQAEAAQTARSANHLKELADLTAAFEAGQIAADTRLHEMQARLTSLQDEARLLAEQLAAAKQAEVTAIATLTESFDARQAAADSDRAALLDELRSLREAEGQAQARLAAIQDAQAAEQRLFAQTRVMLEDEVENLQALLRDQLKVAEGLRSAAQKDKDLHDSLRQDRNAALARAKALDEAINSVLSEAGSKLPSPLRSKLESLRQA